MLKYKLLIKEGWYPRTHSLRDLIRRIATYNPEVEALLKEEISILFVTKLKDAYVVARYLPRRYDRDEVKALARFVKEVFKPFVDRV
ncbi:MAG: HEPN domain-containing protein [Nitrososphaerales archaeon]